MNILEPELNPPEPTLKSQEYQCVPITPVLGMWRWVDPWGLLNGQLSQAGKLQVQLETLFQIKKNNKKKFKKGGQQQRKMPNINP